MACNLYKRVSRGGVALLQGVHEMALSAAPHGKACMLCGTGAQQDVIMAQPA